MGQPVPDSSGEEPMKMLATEKRVPGATDKNYRAYLEKRAARAD